MPLSTYLPAHMGHATIEPQGRYEAGSFQSFTLTYVAGSFGIDDTGGIRIVLRHVTDMGRPQFRDPAAPGWVTAEASNGATLELRWDDKIGIRPWDRALSIRVLRGFMREADRIVVRLGDRREGSPGIRMQTFCEAAFEFRVLADPFATCDWVQLPRSPVIDIVPGPPVRWLAVLPTVRRAGEPFHLGLRGEDVWGNPSDRCDLDVRLQANLPVAGLPDSVHLRTGEFATVLHGLRVLEPGDLHIDLIGPDGSTLARANPLRIVAAAALLPYWCDLHGQSCETIGTNTAEDYLRFARDRAFLDVTCHQGNDFQITREFWQHLNGLTHAFNRDGEFVVFPGYEWSGNTALGGDRNVLYLDEGRPVYRSSHALVEDLSDASTDAHDARALFERLQHEDCIVFAHVGGRYADIRYAHDGRLERAVEVHSAWGTFEWLVHDAFELGHRVGITANSDDHKGRPGASHPGAATFGTCGGLTCVLARELTRAGIADALRRRHHYATTGSRLMLDTRAVFDAPATLFDEDPHPGSAGRREAGSAMMGDIVRFDGDSVTFRIEVVAPSPIERIDIRNGKQTVETHHPFAPSDLGGRIRVIWEGAEYRGRGRQTRWDGHARLVGNRFERVRPINFHNPDWRFEQPDAGHLAWTALTTGGFGGFDAWLADPYAGTIAIETALVRQTLPIAGIGPTDVAFEAGGLGRRVRVLRLPETNPHTQVAVDRRVRLRSGSENALWVRVTTEDGHQAWSSPIYILDRDP